MNPDQLPARECSVPAGSSMPTEAVTRQGWLPLSPSLPGVNLLWEQGRPLMISSDARQVTIKEELPEVYAALSSVCPRWMEIGTLHRPFAITQPDLLTAMLVEVASQPTHQIVVTPRLQGGEKGEPEVTLVYLDDESGELTDTCGGFTLYEWLSHPPRAAWQRNEEGWWHLGCPTPGCRPADVQIFTLASASR
jgi:hypothetical protein